MTTRRNERSLTVALLSEDRGYDAGFSAASKKARTLDQQLQQTSRGGIRQMNSSLDASVQKIRNFVGILAGAAITRQLLRWAGDVRDSAVNLNESINAINVVAGDGAQKILEFGKNAATSVGLARSEFNQAVVPIVAMLNNFGFAEDEAADAAIRLTERAADLASVFNVDVNEALGAITAALRGESDPIERFGGSISAARVEALLLNEGLVASASAITDADKVMGRYLLILEDTARVQGDFANTSDDNANRTRIFQARLEDWKAEVGQSVIPVFDQLLDVGEELLPTLEKLAVDVVPQLAEAFGNFVTGLVEIPDLLSNIEGTAASAVVSLGGVTAALFLIGSHPVIAALVAATAGIGLLGDAARENREEVGLLVADLQELDQVQVDTIADIIGRIPEKDIANLRDVGFTMAQVRDLLEQGFFEEENLQEFRDMAKAAGATSSELARLHGTWRALIHLQNQFDDAQTSGIPFAEQRGRLFGHDDDLRRGERAEELLWRHVDALRANRVAAEQHAETALTVEEVVDKYKELDTQLGKVADTYAGQLTQSVSKYLDIFEEAPELEEAQSVDVLLSNLEERVGRIQRFSEGIATLQAEGLFALAGQFIEQGPESINTLEGVLADLDAGGEAAFTLDRTLEASQSAIELWAEQMGTDFALATVPLIDDARSFGEQFAEAVAAGVSENQIDLILRAQLVRGRGLLDTVMPFSAGGIEGRAHGGPVIPGRAYVVGEGGLPELFVPRQAGSVQPLTGGASTVINATFAPVITAGGASAQELSRELVRDWSREVDLFKAGSRRPD